MTLWIRSQDKTILCEATDLEIFEIADDKSMEDCIIGCIRGVLGQYATKKRCIEILDEIQRLIVNNNKTILTTSSDLDQRTYDDILEEIDKNNFTILSCVNTPQVFPLNQNIIYQMPEK